MRPSIASLVLLGATPIAAVSCDSPLVKEIRKYANPVAFCKTTLGKWPQGSRPPKSVQATLSACACFVTSTTSSSARTSCSSVTGTSKSSSSSSRASSSQSSTSLGLTSTRTPSSFGSSSSLATATISASSSSSSLSSSSTTSNIATITSSAAVPIITVVNSCKNGNFAGYDPNWPGGISGWNITGDAKLIQGFAYNGDGSQDTGAVQMITGSTQSNPKRLKARQADVAASIIQQLADVDQTQDYTVRFWYTILANSEASTCRMNAYYGDVLLDSTAYFPVVADAVPGNTPWLEFLSSAPLTSSDGFIRFELSCSGTGYAEVFIDQVLVTNQVTPNNLNDISILYTVTPTTTSSIISSTTSTSESVTSSVAVATVSGTVTSSSDTSSLATSTSSVESSSSSAPVVATTTSTISTKSTAVSPSGAIPTLCVAPATSTTGLTCGKTIYTYSAVYKRINVNDITKDQCAAACLADSGCLSFIWYTQGASCSNGCVLEAYGADPNPDASAGGVSWPVTYDRNCYEPVTCPAPAEDSVCVDKAGSSPETSCTAAFGGTAKSCVTPMLSTTVSGLCGSGACRDLCTQHPSCKSFSVLYSSSVMCNLYAAAASDVATVKSGSSTIFTDISCYACSSTSSVYSYFAPLADPAAIPDLSSCTVDPSSTSSTTSSTSSSIISTSSGFETSSTLAPTITTSSPPSATSSIAALCRTCSPATPTPLGVVCASTGDLVNWDAYGADINQWPVQTSLMECAAICSWYSGCKAYAFNSLSTYGCEFLAEDLSVAGFVVNPSSSVTWSDKSCAVCDTSSCASSASLSSASSAFIASTSSVSTFSSTTSTMTSSSSSATASSTAAPQTCATGLGCTDNWSAAPNNSYCVTRGTQVAQDAYSVSTSTYPYQSSSEQCAAICSQLSGCKASGWDYSANVCSFITILIQYSSFTIGGTVGTVIWSDLGCFDCSACVLEAASATSTSNPTLTASTSSSATASATACTAPAAHLDETLTCGLPGANGNQATAVQNYVISPAGSLVACAARCLAQTQCLSFRYSITDTACYLFTKAAADDGLTYTSTSTSRYYDRGCYTC